ncbi:hypothetical protein PCASD_26159 [Puccinia coronata f. sp. avenae]|uniref:Uncharacterized protein n=1 Tax=Puccinia coronata f. sp. avenae TaxID=200324 RepID=A0A2N5RYH2_9BASI|nr:hypothetical protein PCASD_26159 [Puccinia coronata f. sp. avenae]
MGWMHKLSWHFVVDKYRTIERRLAPLIPHLFPLISTLTHSHKNPSSHSSHSPDSTSRNASPPSITVIQNDSGNGKEIGGSNHYCVICQALLPVALQLEFFG